MTTQIKDAVSRLLSTPAGQKLLGDAEREEAAERLARRRTIVAALAKATALADQEGAAAAKKMVQAEARLGEARAAVTAAVEALSVATANVSNLSDRHRRLREEAERELANLAPAEVAQADRALDALLEDWRRTRSVTSRGEPIVEAERAAREELRRLALSCDPPESVVAAVRAAVTRFAEVLGAPEPPLPKVPRRPRSFDDFGSPDDPVIGERY